MVRMGDRWRRFGGPFRPRLDSLLPLVDSAAWASGIAAAMALRFDLRAEPWSRWSPLTMIAVAVVMHFVAGTLAGLYAGRWHPSSVDEGMALVGAIAVTVMAMLAVNDTHDWPDSRRGTR